MFCFLETDIREQKKYENRIQTSVDNTVNHLRYEMKFENRVKDKNNFFYEMKHCFSFLKLVSTIFYSPSRTMKNALFHLKRSCGYQNIQIFVYPFSPLFLPVNYCFRGCSKINLKFMTSSNGYIRT